MVNNNVINKKDRKSKYLRGIARAFGGTLIFSLPLLMTMEMWFLGFYIDDLRLAILLILLLPLLVGLSYQVGFRRDFDLLSNIMDAMTAFAIGFFTSAVILFLFNIINTGMSTGEILGKIVIQTVPASIGAVFARGVLSAEDKPPKIHSRQAGYLNELFLMAAGALFLAFNLSPTEEMLLISFRTSDWHVFGLIILSILVMHAFVYSIDFRGREEVPEGSSLSGLFFRFTLTGYSIVLLMSIYILWTFGRTDMMSMKHIIMSAVVLSFPGSIGAAAARLII
jgi:putative integral membrane protein (TIGR02587 family)